MTASFVDIVWRSRSVSIEYQWVGAVALGVVDAVHAPHAPQAYLAPVIVFLHEGLGSLSMWRDFPARLCAAAGLRGLVYSRPGYGRSTPRAPDDNGAPDFMHQQAHEVLPALLQALQVQAPPWLFGHSDGGSIALLHAARHAVHAVAGAIVLAPHIVVEDISVQNIEAARVAYETTDLRQRLARYHDDVDSAFWGWNRIWLDPRFRGWSIEAEVGNIRCPLLAVQGLDDEYGTLEQIRGIQRLARQTQLLELPQCGHSPHKDQPQAVIDAAVAFIQSQGDTA